MQAHYVKKRLAHNQLLYMDMRSTTQLELSSEQGLYCYGTTVLIKNTKLVFCFVRELNKLMIRYLCRMLCLAEYLSEFHF